MSLTEISYYFRKFLPFGIILVLVLIILFYASKLFFLFVESSNPSVTYLNPIFDKISLPSVPNASSSAGLQFTLDTIEGRPTTATDAGKVYFLPPTTSRFGYREKIYVMAKTFGFDTEVVKHKLDGTTAVFNDGRQLLRVDITNFNFVYEYRYQRNPGILINSTMPDQQRIQSEAVDFLKGVGRYPEELAQGKTNLIYFNYDQEENTLRVVDRPQEANVVEVDFYRADIGADPQAIPVVSPGYFTSQNHVIMVFDEGKMRVLKAEMSFFEKSRDQVGIYPLINGDTAWEELKNGQGIVISNPNNTQSVTIKKMFLGYYDPEEYQDYLQPVYVFLGDNDFVAYVPAVTQEYLITK